MRRYWRAALLAGLLATLAGCATNPVTGDSELALVSESNEIKLGSEQYQPSRQLQGGDYNLDPALTRYVQQVGARLAQVSDRDLPYEFSIVNDSSPNAWALPGGKIAVNRGLLLELEDEAQLAAVLGHEIVHAAARHGAQGMERDTLLKGAVAVVAIAAGDSRYGELATGAAAVGGGLLNQRYSRDAELEADRYGMRYMQRAGYDPQAAVALQQTFVRLADDRDPNWLQGLFASHPPSQERVERNRQLAAELAGEQATRGGGRLGRQPYRRAIAGLRESKAAYIYYDEGRKLVDRQPAKALQLADRAIEIEPRESLFHGLRGDALAGQQQNAKAQQAYDQALKLNANYFRHYLGRGETRAALGDRAGARRDLQRSLQLLPTADANFALGQLALTDGDREAAFNHFSSASRSRSAIGKAALRQAQAIDLQQHPERYLAVALGFDRGGRLLVQVTNNAQLPVAGVKVVVGRKDAGGRIYRGSEQRLRQQLAPGERAVIRSDIGGIGSSEALQRYGVRVVGATVAGGQGR